MIVEKKKDGCVGCFYSDEKVEKCEYCYRKLNKKIQDVDNDKEDEARVIFLDRPYLKVELNGKDIDGYKTVDFFEINYCPMCGRKLV